MLFLGYKDYLSLANYKAVISYLDTKPRSVMCSNNTLALKTCWKMRMWHKHARFLYCHLPPHISDFLFRIISLYNQMNSAPTGPVDYSGLPESLRYIKRKQGSLIWRRSSPGANSLSKLYLNRNFWKDLRYSMPSVRVSKPQIKV